MCVAGSGVALSCGILHLCPPPCKTARRMKDTQDISEWSQRTQQEAMPLPNWPLPESLTALPWQLDSECLSDSLYPEAMSGAMSSPVPSFPKLRPPGKDRAETGSTHPDQVGGDELWLGLAVLKEPPHAFHPRPVLLGLQQPRQLPQLLRHLQGTPRGGVRPCQLRATGAEPTWKERLTWAAPGDGHISCPMHKPQRQVGLKQEFHLQRSPSQLPLHLPLGDTGLGNSGNAFSSGGNSSVA